MIDFNKTRIPKFRRFVLQNFPFIEEDFDALTDYALICKVIEYLNKVIESTNTTSAQVEVLTNAFNTLKEYVDNYFDNLDVQQEINNKLDDMVEDGTLQEIITTYIQSNVAWTFDTVADMKAATNLIDGSYAQTLGFYEINDGGGGLYYISDTGTANEMDVITVNTTLYANLIVNDTINILQLGAKPNDENYDNQPHLQRAFDLKRITVIGNDVNDVFWVQSASRFYNTVIFNSWLKNSGSEGLENDRILYIENEWSDKTIEVINPLINGNRDTTRAYDGYVGDEYGHGINIRSSQNIKISGGKIINCYGDGIAISTSNESGAEYRYSQNVSIDGVYIDHSYRNGISIISCVNATIKNCTVYNRNGYRTILTEPNIDSTLRNKNIYIDGGYYYGSSGTAVIDYACNRLIENASIKNCKIYNDDGCTCAIRVSNTDSYKLSNLTVENVEIENHKDNMQILITTTNDIIFNNIKIIGDQRLNTAQFKSDSGNIYIKNNYIDLHDNEGGKNARYDIYAYNGIVYYTDNVVKSPNSTSGYSGAVNIQRGDIIYIERNALYSTSNTFGIGTPRSNPGAPTHQFTTKCCYMIDNYVKADANYSSSRGIIIYDSTDITSLYVNYNFYDGITNKCSIWGDVTNSIGDVFA